MEKRTNKVLLVCFLGIMLLFLLGAYYFPIVSFSLNGDKKTTLLVGEKYEEKGAEAKVNFLSYDDNIKINDSNLDCNKTGSYEIVYSIILPNGKEKKVKRHVEIIDNVSPNVKLLGNETIYIDYGGTYKEPGYTVSDNYDSKENLDVVITGTSEIDSKKSGNYEITYTCTDSSGNTSIAKRNVVVSPRIQVKNGITYVEGVLIVNKKYSLPSSYNPGVNKEASNALYKLQNDASKQGYNLKTLSGFRSYYDQKYIYNQYVASYGVEKTDTFSARPGHSEHQTGLAFDVGKINDNFGDTPSGKWLAENAHKYGFIIRYPKGKQSITGYKYEPWHIRYLGVELATKVKNSGLSLEEYLNI